MTLGGHRICAAHLRQLLEAVSVQPQLSELYQVSQLLRLWGGGRGGRRRGGGESNN